MKQLILFPKKLVVTINFKSGKTVKIICDKFDISDGSWNAKGCLQTSGGWPHMMDTTQIESIFYRKRRVFAIYRA